MKKKKLYPYWWIGRKHSEHSKKLMCEKRKGKVPYQTTIAINKKISETWKRKFREGFINPMKGKKRPDFKENLKNPDFQKKRFLSFMNSPNTSPNNKKVKIESSQRMKLNNPMKRKEVMLKQRETIIKMWQEGKIKRNNKKPNKSEQVLINLIKENNLPFNYVGNNQVIIGGFNPDFLSKNPKHIIELFGDYWHRNTQERDKRRLETYFKYGYKTLVIWEHELKNLPNIIDKINNFIKT